MRTCNVNNWRDFTKMPKQKIQTKTPKIITKNNAAAKLKNLARRGNNITKGGMRVRLRDISENEI